MKSQQTSVITIVFLIICSFLCYSQAKPSPPPPLPEKEIFLELFSEGELFELKMEKVIPHSGKKAIWRIEGSGEGKKRLDDELGEQLFKALESYVRGAEVDQIITERSGDRGLKKLHLKLSVQWNRTFAVSTTYDANAKKSLRQLVTLLEKAESKAALKKHVHKIKEEVAKYTK